MAVSRPPTIAHALRMCWAGEDREPDSPAERAHAQTRRESSASTQADLGTPPEVGLVHFEPVRAGFSAGPRSNHASTAGRRASSAAISAAIVASSIFGNSPVTVPSR